MWYGSNTYPNLYRQLKNRNNRLNWKDRKIGFSQERQSSDPSRSTFFKVPAGWELVVLKKPKAAQQSARFYIFTDTYFIGLTPLSTLSELRYDAQTRTFIFQYHFSSYLHSAYLRWLNELLSRFHRPFFLKVRFKGKGYYMYKNYRNTIAPQFGYAHRVYVYAQAISVRFLSKTKVLLFGLSKRDVTAVAHNLKQVKPINIFTGRGVRFARQVVYKKTGKVSSYR